MIFWETTRTCNLDCPHCRASAQRERLKEELTTQEAKRFIKEASSISHPILVFSGGEPLIREDIYELIYYTKDLGLKPALATNATLINATVADNLKKSGIELVAVSVYGKDALSHDSFCGKNGAFALVLAGIKELKAKDIPFQINTTITQKNLDELEAIGDFSLKQGAVAYHVFFLVPTGRGRYIEGDRVSAQEFEEAFCRLSDLQLNFPLRIKATCAPHYSRVLRQRQSSFNLPTRGCLAGGEVCFISYKGEVFGCGYLPLAAGDLRKQDFQEIWFESELFQDLRDEEKLVGKCGVCEFKRICGGCRARAYARFSNYLEEEPDCVYQPLNVKS